MKYVFRYLGEYKKESILAPLFKMLEAIFELLVPLVMAKIIDYGIAAGDKAYIMRMCSLLVLLAVVGLVSSITAQYFAAKAATYAAGNMRRDLFYHMMSLSNEQMDLAGGATLVTRVTNDVTQVQNGMNMFLRLFLRSPFIVFGAVIMAFTVDVKGALVFCVVIPVLALIVYLIMRRTLPMYKKIQKQLDHLLLRVDEGLSGVRVLRAFRRQKVEEERFQNENRELYDYQMKTGGISAWMNPLTYVFVNLGVVFILWVGALRVNAGDLLTGETVALVNYMNQILVELIKLANLIVLLVRAFASVSRMEEVLETTPDTRKHGEDLEGKNSVMATDASFAEAAGSEKTASGGEEPLVSMKDVCFSYADGGEVLSHIDFSVKPGEFIGVVGGTGSGKSTLVSLLRHNYDATEGEIFFDGKPVESYSDEELNRRIGLVPQRAALFMGTIESNLKMARKDATEQEMQEALAVARAKEIVDGKPLGLQEPVQKGGTNFSGGQRQRLTIARELLKQSPLLILDDSSSALDLATERALREGILSLPNHPAVIMISQRASSVLMADKILVLEDGAVAGYGSHEELMKDCEIYQEIYYAQFPKDEEVSA